MVRETVLDWYNDSKVFRDRSGEREGEREGGERGREGEGERERERGRGGERHESHFMLGVDSMRMEAMLS